MQKRRAEESLLQIQAEAASAKLEAEAAKAEAEQAKLEARIARDEIFDASPLHTPFTPGVPFPGIQMVEQQEQSSSETTPAKKPEPKKADTAPAGSMGGWFWSRRTASTTKATVPIEDK